MAPERDNGQTQVELKTTSRTKVANSPKNMLDTIKHVADSTAVDPTTCLPDGSGTAHGPNPQPLAILPQPRGAEAIVTLALDLGTHTGWALMVGREIVASGTIHLATEVELAAQRLDGRERSLDVRFLRLLGFINAKLAGRVDRVIFEDVTFIGSRMQGQLWASFRTAIWAAAATKSFSILCVHTGTLKAFAAGHGGAGKPEMAQALISSVPGTSTGAGGMGVIRKDGAVMDDNEIDAIWLARFAAAVDAGKEQIQSAHQRRAAALEAKRAKRRAAKAARKIRKQAETAAVKLKRTLIKQAIRVAGRCCGLWRKPAPGGRAVCPKCCQGIKLRFSASGGPVSS